MKHVKSYIIKNIKFMGFCKLTIHGYETKHVKSQKKKKCETKNCKRNKKH